jgi:ribosomal protein S18 acetylase RimI-like enzyme
MFSLRLANSSDAAIIVDFNCRLASETEGKQLDRRTVERGVATLLADPRHGRYFVACDDGRVIGQMMHTYEWSDWRNGQIWWLQSVYVAADYRKRGVFRALFEHVLQTAEADPGVVGVRLYVEEGNESAQAAYHKLGLEEAGYHVMERMFV